MSDTLFAYFKGTVSNADDTDPETSSSFYYPPLGATHNVVKYRRQTIQLDDADTHVITFPGYAVTDWVGLMIRVIGTAKLVTVGVDWDGTTPIGATMNGYGTSRYPGMISLVTTKVTSFTLTGLEDGTEIEYLAMILALDSAI